MSSLPKSFLWPRFSSTPSFLCTGQWLCVVLQLCVKQKKKLQSNCAYYLKKTFATYLIRLITKFTWNSFYHQIFYVLHKNIWAFMHTHSSSPNSHNHRHWEARYKWAQYSQLSYTSSANGHFALLCQSCKDKIVWRLCLGMCGLARWN